MPRSTSHALPAARAIRAVRRILAAAAVLASLAAAPAAAQEAPLPPAPTEYVYARSLGLGAFRGVAGGNDTIFYNPAAMAARRRFTIELGGLVYRVGADTDASMFGGSVVDSASSPVTGGFSYNYVTTLGYKSKFGSGGMMNVAIAFPLGKGLYLGSTLTYLNVYSDYGTINAVTLNAAAFWELGNFFSLGATGYNLINTSHPVMLPYALGAGAAAGPDRVFHVTGDWYREWSSDGLYRDVWSAGAELFLFDVAAARGGWLYDAGRRVQWWSAGAGFAYEGLGADFTYRQTFGGATYKTLAVSVRFQVPM